MPTITKIKMTGFIDSRDYAVSNEGIFTYKKSRPTDIEGVYKATEAYQVHLDKADIKTLFNAKSNRNYENINGCEIPEYYSKLGLLPKERLYISNDIWVYNFLTKDGFKHFTKSGDLARTQEYDLIVFTHSDFVKLQPTKKEQEIINKLANRNKMQNLNRMVVADNIIKTLQDNNYDVRLYKSNREYDAFFFQNKKSFNALVKDALEYYLNNIVLKELGCKITVPKQKSTHGYKYDDVLCYVGDIEMVNEGEQDGSKNLN